MQTELPHGVKPPRKFQSPLHDVDLARMVLLRQELWIEGWQTPPGQECSNGSLILLAIVSWRTFTAQELEKIAWQCRSEFRQTIWNTPVDAFAAGHATS
jgi:hypothetical protein